ncbi:MAG: RagB/SusD family nutrient uptake outer membrane protein [Tannerella sp.]|jgi:hypothetical protein|nr:RagB/SusD family nutrient uptake outer membrane protein [Tannerella sp.]
MKKYIFITGIAIASFAFQSCDDTVLDEFPQDRLSSETFFRTEQDLKLYTNSLLSQLDASPFGSEPDNLIGTTFSEEVRGIRDPSTTGGWNWGNLRSVNYFLDNSYKCQDAAIRVKYEGIARWFRANFYFYMVKRFGDVPWYSHVLGETDNEQLYKGRDPRALVMDSVLADINFAVANCPTDKKTYEITKWTALALKSRICLFEGIFRKYHGISGSEKFIDEAISAGDELINSGQYSIYNGSGPDVAYRDLFTSIDAISQEMILAKGYSVYYNITHWTNSQTLAASLGQNGLEKQLIDSYLMDDGSRFTDIPDYDKKIFVEEMVGRDKRLSQTIRGLGYKRIGGNEVLAPQFGYTTTGYHPIKYVCSSQYDNRNNENDLPILRYAEVLLNTAEAKAEKGTLTQADIDRTIKLIRARVAMPNLDMAAANADPDPFLAAQYPLVTGANKGVILEIRRERRVELVQEEQRYPDLMRWKAGKQLERLSRGMYFPGPGAYDLTGDGVNDLIIHEASNKPSAAETAGISQVLEIGTNILLEHGTYGNAVWLPNVEKHWDEDKDYLYPIPLTETILNPNLGQNPGWER